MAAQKESSDAPAKGGMTSLIVAALGVILAGLGGGYGAAIVLIPQHAETPAPAKAAEPATEKPAAAHGEQAAKQGDSAAEAEPVAPTEVLVLPLQAIVTNLKEPAEVWIRLEGSLVIRKQEEHAPPPDLALRMSQHYLAYLRTLKLADFEGTQGLYAINQDMNEIATSLSDGLVTEFLISSLVLE
jgi:flagellar basal body-associated protein FliL